MKKCIVSIILLLCICFTSLCVSAVEYQSNDEMMKSAAETLRDKMLDRESKYYITTQYIAEEGEQFHPTDIARKIYNRSVSEELAINSSCGSYLKLSIDAFGMTGRELNQETLEDGRILYTIGLTYTFEYYTTKEQEEKLDRAIDLWVRLNIKNEDSEFDKTFNIYKFITDNVDYDYTYKKNTAYDAFYSGTSMCQGYSTLFYKMCKLANLQDVFILTGKANNGSETGPHAWNAIKLDGKYYYLDPTWDGTQEGEAVQFSNFLRGSDIFNEYHFQEDLEEFNKLYTVSKKDFTFITNKISEREDMGLLIGFDLSKGIITEENLLNDNYFRNDTGIEIDIECKEGIIGTDSRIDIKKNGILLNAFVVVMYGDINGDGKISAVDALTLIKGINGKIYFEQPSILEAGRILTTGNNKPKAADALAIIKHINGKYTINQSK